MRSAAPASGLSPDKWENRSGSLVSGPDRGGAGSRFPEACLAGAGRPPDLKEEEQVQRGAAGGARERREGDSYPAATTPSPEWGPDCFQAPPGPDPIVGAA